jgi:transcriptional regulator with XRE-family HTH domain
METTNYSPSRHIGRKIERIRKLRGITQTELGNHLNITKQAISKMEQSEKIEDEKIKQVAEALGVTEEGLKKFNEESVFYTYNFYENSGVTAASIGAHNIETLNNYPLIEKIEFFEKLLKKEMDKSEKDKSKKKV